MKTEYRKDIRIDVKLPREVAERLLLRLNDSSDFADIIIQIENELKPIYVYKSVCNECGKEVDWGSDVKLTNKEAAKHWGDWSICEKCSDSEDFK